MRAVAFMSGGKAFEWFTGSPYELPKRRVLVLASCLAYFWTWIDKDGERVWDYAGKL